MNLLGGILVRLLDVADIGIESCNALWRVLLRGAFSPDAKSYRSSRFASLASTDLLVQDIALNAGDASEARQAVLIDAERLLPLAPDLVVYDVVGPLEEGDKPRSRPERIFLLGVARKDTLARVRTDLPALRRGGVEAFVHAPSGHPKFALVFNDEIGVRKRRARRTLLIVAFVVFAIGAGDAMRSADEFLRRRVESANAEQLAAERRIRLAERDKARAEAEGATLAQNVGPALSEVSDRLSLVARHQPLDSQLDAIGLEDSTLSLRGRAYAPDAAELSWRRAFEGEEITFSTQEGEAPRTFEARFNMSEQEAP